MTQRKYTTKKLVYMAVLIALSFVGSMVKIQGSIALDSMPGFLAALLLGPIEGALVGLIGHLITALTSGFPHTIVVHLIIGVAMGLTAYVFAYIYKRFNPILAVIVGTIINGPLLLLLLWPITSLVGLALHGKAFFLTLLIPLSLASAVNLVLAAIVYKLLKARI